MKSIRLKLWSVMMSIIVIAILLLWVFQIVFFEEFYADTKIDNLKKRGYEIISQIGELNEEQLKAEVDSFSYNDNLNIQIVDFNRKKIYESTGGMSLDNKPNSNFRLGRGQLSDSEFQKILENKEVISSYSHSRFGNKIMMVGLPLKLNDNSSGGMIINIPLVAIEDTVDILKRQLVYIIFILLAITTAISSLFSKFFTKPILEIQKMTKQIAKGDFEQRVDVKGKDEIGSLAESINYTAKELSKIDQLRKDLIANVSHELRTPLSLVQGYAEVIKDVSGDTKEKRDKHIDIIIDESKRLSRVVDDILNISQIQAGYIVLNKTDFSINKLIYDIEKKFEILSKDSKSKMELKLDKDVNVFADKTKIEQVLYNFLNNAYNHIEKDGLVIVSTKVDDSLVKVEVKDNGKGISKDDIQYIWDRYYKNDKTNQRGNIGTGLGLSIVKSIFEAHDIEYGVDSTEGQGAKFWFKIKISGKTL